MSRRLFPAILSAFVALTIPSGPSHAGIRLSPASLGLSGGSDLVFHDAPPAPRAPRELGSATATGTWTHLDVAYRPGRTRTAALANYGFEIAVGSDECGFWRTWSPFFPTWDWSSRGDELGGGVVWLTYRYVGDIDGERVCAVRSRGDSLALVTSDDDGITWSPSSFSFDDFEVQSVKRMIPDAEFANVSYLLCTGYYPAYDTVGWLLARSFDGGATWDEVWYDDYISNADLWVSRQAPSTIYVATDDFADIFIEESTDLLGSWSQYGVASGYGGYEEGLTVTADEASPGKVWFLAASELLDWDGTTLTSHGYPTIQEGLLDGAVFTADFLMGSDGQVVSVSSDGGDTWTELPHVDWVIDTTQLNEAPTAIQCLAPLQDVFPTSPGTRPRRNGPASPADVIPTERFYISTGSGTSVYDPSDGSIELLTDETVQNTQIEDLALLHGADTYMMDVGTRDLGKPSYRTSSLPLNWSGLTTSYPNDCGSTATNLLPDAADPFILAQFSFGGSLSGQGMFSGVGLAKSFGDPEAFHQLVADPGVSARWYWCDNEVVQIDYDQGTNSFTTTWIGRSAFWGGKLGFAVAPSDTSVRYASALGYGPGPIILRSLDAGASWIEVASNGPSNPDARHYRTTILVSPTDPDDVWVAGDAILHASDGQTFTDATAGLPATTRTYDLAWQGGGSGAVWAATDHGVFRWNGGSWEDMTPPASGVPDVPFHAVEADPALGVVRAGSWGRGMFEFGIGSATGVPDLPVSAMTLVPSRNPAHRGDRLEFTLPEAGRVTIDLLDVQGRRVATVLDGPQPAGRGSAALDPTGLPAGVYFARMTAGRATRTTKVVLTR